MLVEGADHASSQNLQPLLEARSIALIGASKRVNSFGCAMLEMALADGFKGGVFPVNPKYETLGGVECYPNLNALPVGNRCDQ
ncbi:MAG: CoA-binding protein [Arenicellales bacterium]